MAAKDKTLADYLAIAISPALIMALVGSLVFFLLEVLYEGMYQGKLQWILFFFVFGAVLIARISMDLGNERAAAYGFLLGLAVWFALVQFIKYPPESAMATWGWAINLGLIAIIWWSAHRLTWDCTLIDDEVDASGAGLLEVAGLEKNTTPQRLLSKEEEKTKKRDPAGIAGWLARFWRYRAEQRKKPHAPGVWVVYFSLAALPLFGLGQAQIPVEDEGRRAYTFWLMLIYVGSGLGLLLATSFLGLRRYLRQRKLRMPPAITAAWLVFGLGLVGALMLVGAALPRPADANPLWRWAGVGGEKQKPSQWGKGQGEEEKKDKNPGEKKAEEDDPDAVKDKGAGEEKDPQGGKDKKSPSSKDGKGKNKKGDQGEKGDKKDRKSDPDKAKSDPPPSNSWQGLLDFLGKLLKWLVLAAVAALALFYGIRFLLQFLANFTGWAKNLLAWWNHLFASTEKRGKDEGQTETEAPPLPFSSYRDPFVAGVASRMSGTQLVRYSFEAMEAWARERDFARHVGETPLEFADRVADEAPAMEKDARRLAHLYAGLAYARANLSEQGRESIRIFWEMLTEVAISPLSAATK